MNRTARGSAASGRVYPWNVRSALAFALDVILVLGFAALGRRSHEEGSSVVGVVEVAAPFLIALVLGWLMARAWRAPASLRTGLIVWPVTVVVGLALRSVVFDRGIAIAFCIVALLTLGVLLMGWRVLARFVPRRAGRLGEA